MIADTIRRVTPRAAARGEGRARARAAGAIAALLWPFARMMRSMLGQMALVTALFLGCGVYLMAVRPILSNAPLGTPDPMDATRQAISQRLTTAMVDADAEPGAIAALARDPLFEQVRRGNPGFVYYVARGDRSGGTTRPSYGGTVGLDRLDALLATMRRSYPAAPDPRIASPQDPSLCVQMERRLNDASGVGYFSYGNCGIPSYIEFRGLRTALPLSSPGAFETRMRWLWSYSRPFLVPALGLFVLLSAILAVNVVRIRRVARLTRTLRTEGPRYRLSQDGLPSEMLPLVRAVNQLIGQADDDQRKRRFFLSAAAHEMRTPLTVLRTRMEILPDSDLKTKLIRDLAQLTALSNDLLTLTGIDRGRPPFAAVDLSEACLDVIGDLEPLASARGVGFRFVAPGDPPQVTGDAALIRVAITNLIDNAISFAPVDSDVVVTLDGAGGVEVRDFGPGLGRVDADTLFEPFVRASSDRPGHGLGLAIVKAVADLHGGRVVARNAPGGGARFNLDFLAPDRSAEGLYRI